MNELLEFWFVFVGIIAGVGLLAMIYIGCDQAAQALDNMILRRRYAKVCENLERATKPRL